MHKARPSESGCVDGRYHLDTNVKALTAYGRRDSSDWAIRGRGGQRCHAPDFIDDVSY